MAWYAELKRRRWYRVVGFDAIRLYRKWLWCCLPNENKERILERRRLQDEKDAEEAEIAVRRLLALTDYLHRRCGGPYL